MIVQSDRFSLARVDRIPRLEDRRAGVKINPIIRIFRVQILKSYVNHPKSAFVPQFSRSPRKKTNSSPARRLCNPLSIFLLPDVEEPLNLTVRDVCCKNRQVLRALCKGALCSSQSEIYSFSSASWLSAPSRVDLSSSCSSTSGSSTFDRWRLDALRWT